MKKSTTRLWENVHDLGLLAGETVDILAENGTITLLCGDHTFTARDKSFTDGSQTVKVNAVSRVAQRDYRDMLHTDQGAVIIDPELDCDYAPWMINSRLPTAFVSLGDIIISGNDIIATDAFTKERHIFTHNGEVELHTTPEKGWGMISFSYFPRSGTVWVDHSGKGDSERIATITLPPGTLLDLTYRVE